MTYEEFEKRYLDLEPALWQQYADFIIENSAGDRIVSNGAALIAAMEDEYLLEEFQARVVTHA